MVKHKPVSKTLATMVTVVLVFASLIGLSAPAQAVTNHSGTTSYTTTFYGYVVKGERVYVTASGHQGATVRNEAGASVKLSGGYTPVAASSGVWQVTLRGSYSDNSAGFTYEVSVRSGTTNKPGRVWVDTDTIYQNGVTNLNYFGVSDLGYIYQINMKKTNPINAIIALRSSGAAPNSQCNVQNKSIDSTVRDTPAAGYLDCGDKYKLFFEDPRGRGLPATAKMGNQTIQLMPPPATTSQVSASTRVAFTANTATPGGTFRVTSHPNFSGTAELQVDTNNNGSYTDSVDVEKTVVINSGVAAPWAWNGKNGSGADVTGATKARVVISKVGEAHLLLSDFEAMGGLTMTGLNGDTPDSLIFWDDSALLKPRGGAATPVKVCLQGCNSNTTNGIHGWNESTSFPDGTESRSWGDGRIIDNWTYARLKGNADVVSPVVTLPALHTLSFNGNGGTISGVTSIKRSNGLAWGTLPTATLAHNDFQGWYTAKTGGSQVTASTVATGNLTVYAQWKLTPRILTFDTNGGALSGAATITQPHGSAWGTLSTATLANNDFQGWFTAKTGGTQVTAATLATGNVTVYAQWKLTPRVLTLDANGGKSNGVVSITKPHGSAWGALPTATLANNDFQGWFTAKVGGTQVTADTLATGNITAYAQWKLTPRVLTFDPNGGALSGAATITQPHGSPWGTLSTATLLNNDFQGWFTAKTGGTQVTATTLAAGNITVYAQWKLTPRTLTFDANGGELNGVGSITKPHGSAWGALPTATQAAKVFLGWSTATTGGTPVTAATLAIADVTVYAQWRPAKYNVVFYGNAQMGAVTGSTASMMVDSGCTTCLLTANGFTKTTGAPVLIDPDLSEMAEVNSKFLGWSLDPLSHTGDIADRAVAGALSQTDGATVKLYAIWDDAPRFVIESYPNRFFGLEDAKAGVVTEAELLSTVTATDKETVPLEKKTSEQVLSSGSDVGVTLYDYVASDYTSLTNSGVVSVTYKVKDKVGNVAFLRIRVTVSDGSAIPSSANIYLRGIAPQYVDEGPDGGGLSTESLWRTDPVRQAALDAALKGGGSSTYCLDAAAVNALRTQVGNDGLGNSETPGGLAASVESLRGQGACG